MRIRVKADIGRMIIAGVAGFLLVSNPAYTAPFRPSAPTITSVSYSTGNGTLGYITCNLSSSHQGSVNYHIVCLSDLSTSLGTALKAATKATESGADGPAIAFERQSETSTTPVIKIPVLTTFRERYFIAAAVSVLNPEDSSRIFSGWSLWKSADGTPLAVTTAPVGNETVYYKAQYLGSSRDQVVCMVTFKTTGSCSLYVRHGSNTLLGIDASTIVTSGQILVSDSLGRAISAGLTSGAQYRHLILRNQRDNTYSVFSLVPNYKSGDSLAIKVKNNGTNEILGEGVVSPAVSLGMEDIIETIHTLTLISTTAQDPINPGPIPAYSHDTVTAKLFAAAMVNLTIAHNSPEPNQNEEEGGIFTNYIQFMDNVARKWNTGGIRAKSPGFERLKAIYGVVLETNKGVVEDPVWVVNRGVTAEFGQPVRKRKNYAYYRGYIRLDCDVNRSTDLSQPTGAGIMFRVSGNIELYAAKHPDSLKMFDSAFITGAFPYKRIVFSIKDSIIGKLNSSGPGIWVKANAGVSADEVYHLNITPVRLPISTESYSIGVQFSIPRESKNLNDIVGQILDGPERSVFRIYELREGWDRVDTLKTSRSPEFLLHGERRILEFDSNFLDGGQVTFFAAAKEKEDEGKIFIEDPQGNRAVLVDYSHTGDKGIIAGAKRFVNGILNGIFHVDDLESKTIAIKDAVGGVYRPQIVDGQVFCSVPIENQRDNTPPSSWPREEIRVNATYTLRWTDGVIMNESDKLENYNWIPRDANRKLFDTVGWPGFEALLVGKYKVSTIWAELRFSKEVEKFSVELSDDTRKKTETVYFDMKSNYERTRAAILARIQQQCECKQGTEFQECRVEAETITKRYLEMWQKYANDRDSYGIRRAVQQNAKDVKSGYMCFHWAFYTQQFIGIDSYKHFKVDWSAFMWGLGDFAHSWISISTCRADADSLLHLDAWADNRLRIYNTEEHHSIIGQEYGLRNYVGKIGLPKGYAEGIYYPKSGEAKHVKLKDYWPEKGERW